MAQLRKTQRKVPVYVRLPEDLVQDVKRAADRTGRTKTKIIEMGTRKFVTQLEE